MNIQKIIGGAYHFINAARSKLIIFDKNDIINVITTKDNKTVLSNFAKVKRVSKDSYVRLDTGEIINYNRSATKADNTEAIKCSINKIRKLILNNFVAFEGFLITLTYNEPMYDFEVATKDFVKFYDRLKYRYSDYKFDYLRIIEPQQFGAWHIHIIIKSALENQQLRIYNDDITKLWTLGLATIRQLYDIEGLANYFGTYYNKSEDSNVNSRTMSKQSRWYYYPPGARVFAKSQGIKYPSETVMSYNKAREYLNGYELVSEPVAYNTINDNDVVVNSVLYENYRKKRI